MPWYVAVVGAIRRVDWDAQAAIALTLIGWFLLDTLRLTWGPVEHAIPFYEVPLLLASPARLLTGFEGQRGTGTVLFTLLCFGALLAPLAPYFWRARSAWLGWSAPFALIVICAGLLYLRMSGDFFRMGGGDTLANDLRHIGNHLLHRAGAGVAHRVTFAAGGYLALLSSAYLAVRGIRGWRNHRS
jgi:hypothetical protein